MGFFFSYNPFYLSLKVSNFIKIFTVLTTSYLIACSKTGVDSTNIISSSSIGNKEIRSAIVKQKENQANTNKVSSSDLSHKTIKTPSISSLISFPPAPKFGGDKIISFSTTEKVPLKDTLIELGRVMQIDLDIDPGISGGISMNAKKRPLLEVLDRIALLGNLRYSYNNGVLFFERDNPYIKNYAVGYLRSAKSWGDTETNLKSILTSFDQQNQLNSLAQQMNQGILNPNLQPGIANQIQPNGMIPNNMMNNGIANQIQPNNGMMGNNMMNQMQPNGMMGMGMMGMGMNILTANMITNKSSGIITIFANKKQHDAVEEYLKNVEKYSSAQVLIEAKVIEVQLSDKYKTGIDWSWIDAGGSGKSSGSLTNLGGYDATSPISIKLGGILFGGSISSSISALESFGVTKTISSPRVHAMNNQESVLNFTDKLVYFQVTNTQTTTAGNPISTSTTIGSNVTATSNSTKQEENVGVKLTITPSINIETREITLDITPTISVKSGEVVDPVNVNNRVPVIQTREVKTTAQILDGNIIIIGGLMKDTATNLDNGIPFIQRIPVLGWLFKSSSKDSTVTETVILIKATIVNSRSIPNKIDREIQNKFDTNRRAFF